MEGKDGLGGEFCGDFCVVVSPGKVLGQCLPWQDEVLRTWKICGSLWECEEWERAAWGSEHRSCT